MNEGRVGFGVFVAGGGYGLLDESTELQGVLAGLGDDFIRAKECALVFSREVLLVPKAESREGDDDFQNEQNSECRQDARADIRDVLRCFSRISVVLVRADVFIAHRRLVEWL